MRTLAGWCVRHRRIVLLLWAAVLVSSLVLVSALHADYTNNFNFPHTESSDAINLLKSVAPGHSGDTEEVVFGTSGGTSLNDPAVGQRINTMVDKINALPNVTTVSSPYDAAGTLVNTTNINADHTVGFLQVPFDKLPNKLTQDEATKFVHTVTSTSSPGLTVAVTGQLAEFANNQSFSSSGLGVLLALIVLLLVFGSVFAALLPIISALFALGTAIGIIGLLSHVIGMPEFSPELVLLIGLGVGVDYALFIVTRHRQGLAAGYDPVTSIVDCRQHFGSCGPVRRSDRLHRAARHVRSGRQLPLRPGGGGGHRRPPHHDLGADPSARHARLHRPQGDEPQAEAEPGRERPAHRRRRQQGVLAELGRPGPALPMDRRRGGPHHHRRSRAAVLLAPPRLGGPGQRPGRHAHLRGVRHAVAGSVRASTGP